MSAATARQPRIAVVGNTVVDILARGGELEGGHPGDAWSSATDLLVEPIHALLGGCGAGPAYVAGCLGAEVTLYTNLARDALGGVAARWLECAGVEIVAPPSAGLSTAVHAIRVDDRGRRRSAYYPGGPVPWRACLVEQDAAWLLASGYGGVAAADAQVLGEVFAQLRARGTRVLFDPSPWFARCVEPPAMAALWRQVDVLCGTAEETAHWVGADCADRRPGGGLEWAMQVAIEALALGPSTVVVKDGPRGAAHARRGHEAGSIPARPVEGANTVGAGDAFNGRLAWGLARGEDLAAVASAAVDVAGRVVRQGRGVLGAFSREN